MLLASPFSKTSAWAIIIKLKAIFQTPAGWLSGVTRIFNCQQIVRELTLEEIQRSKLKWVQYKQAMIKQVKDIEKLEVSLNLFEDSDNILRIT